MAAVPVFVPWHVAARDTIAEWIPAAGQSRKVALVAGSAVAAVLAVITVALATQTDLLLFTTDVAVDRLREIVVSGAGSVIVEDVPDGALAIARERQTIKPGWAKRRMRDEGSSTPKCPASTALKS